MRNRDYKEGNIFKAVPKESGVGIKKVSKNLGEEIEKEKRQEKMVENKEKAYRSRR